MSVHPVMSGNSIALFSARFANGSLTRSQQVTGLRWSSPTEHLPVCPFARYLPTSSMPLVRGFRPMKEDGWLPTS
jgi:hypothetical protein